ncbi:Paf1-domain-containing protein [Mycena sp. CBHHK59/15]|nr:Paf1-domain-containing protein [Mycena sp. CBHHK59/15]
MSSKKNSKLDLLVRVRYSNPLPAPPCPPKLLDIPTNPMRYARPAFLNMLANDMPLPMIVDAECGMPLDLRPLGDPNSRWAQLDVELNPDPDDLPLLDPEDAALLAELAPSSATFVNGQSASGPSTPLPAHVPWLRKTEYISREGVQRPGVHEPKHVVAAPIDVSREAQLRDIEASFAACNDVAALAALRHPNKPNVRAVDSYELLPDKEIWANQYDLFRFSERPGERPIDAEHDSFLAYYLTADDESAIKFKETRLRLHRTRCPPSRRRRYSTSCATTKTVKVEQEVPNEFLLVPNIERKMLLKKKRVNALDGYNDKWEIIRMTHVAMGEEEEAERNELLAEVDNPRFLREDVDADGDIELDDAGATVGNG